MKRIQTGNSDIQKLQTAVAESLEPLENLPLNSGVLISGIRLLSSGVTRVDHGLGRAPLGYLIVKRSVSSSIWDSESSIPKRQLNLQTSADVTVSLWVF